MWRRWSRNYSRRNSAHAAWRRASGARLLALPRLPAHLVLQSNSLIGNSTFIWLHSLAKSSAPHAHSLGDGVVANVVLKDTKATQRLDRYHVRLAKWRCSSAYSSAPRTAARFEPGGDPSALAAAGKFEWPQVPVYLLAQMLGACLGAFWSGRIKPISTRRRAMPASLLCFATGSRHSRDGPNLVSENHWHVLASFAVLTSRVRAAGGLARCAPGGQCSGDRPLLGGTTGYAINPARDLGPRLMHALLPLPNKGTSDWNYAWIPVWTIIGGLVAAVYRGNFDVRRPILRAQPAVTVPHAYGNGGVLRRCFEGTWPTLERSANCSGIHARGARAAVVTLWRTSSSVRAARCADKRPGDHRQTARDVKAGGALASPRWPTSLKTLASKVPTFEEANQLPPVIVLTASGGGVKSTTLPSIQLRRGRTGNSRRKARGPAMRPRRERRDGRLDGQRRVGGGWRRGPHRVRYWRWA